MHLTIFQMEFVRLNCC